MHCCFPALLCFPAPFHLPMPSHTLQRACLRTLRRRPLQHPRILLRAKKSRMVPIEVCAKAFSHASSRDKASKMPVQAFLKHPFAPSKQSQDCTDVTIRALFALKAHRRLRKDKDVPTTRGRKRTRVAGLSSRTKQCGLCAIRASNDMDFARYGPRTLRPLHDTGLAQFEPRAKKRDSEQSRNPALTNHGKKPFWHPCAIARTAA